MEERQKPQISLYNEYGNWCKNKEDAVSAQIMDFDKNGRLIGPYCEVLKELPRDPKSGRKVLRKYNMTKPDNYICGGCDACRWIHSDCWYCKHLTEELTCPAFPNGIPEALVYGFDTHRELIEGQIGDFIYEVRNKKFDRNLEARNKNILDDLE